MKLARTVTKANEKRYPHNHTNPTSEILKNIERQSIEHNQLSLNNEVHTNKYKRAKNEEGKHIPNKKLSATTEKGIEPARTIKILLNKTYSNKRSVNKRNKDG